MAKKDFSKGNAAVDRFFNNSQPLSDNQLTDDDEVAAGADAADEVKRANKSSLSAKRGAKNKSKHFEERGPRNERFGLLMDAQLKEDLNILAKISDSTSVNDLVVSVLLDYVGGEDVKKKLAQYRKMF